MSRAKCKIEPRYNHRQFSIICYCNSYSSMSKTAPIALTFVLLFSVFGYVAIDSNTNNTDDSPSSSDVFVCDDGEEISADLQNNGNAI